MSSRNKRSFIKLLLFICIVIGVLIYYDIQQQGSWQKSHGNKFLKDSGIWTYTFQFFYSLKNGLLMLDDHFDKNYPAYRSAVVDFSEPYVQLLGNLGRILYNIFTDLKHLAKEQYPILIQFVQRLMEESQNIFTNVWSISTFYINTSVDFSVDFLKKEVFIGQLSPENVQRVVFEAFNTTQNKATEYLHWLYGKVQSNINY